MNIFILGAQIFVFFFSLSFHLPHSYSLITNNSFLFRIFLIRTTIVTEMGILRMELTLIFICLKIVWGYTHYAQWNESNSETEKEKKNPEHIYRFHEMKRKKRIQIISDVSQVEHNFVRETIFFRSRSFFPNLASGEKIEVRQNTKV